MRLHAAISIIPPLGEDRLTSAIVWQEGKIRFYAKLRSACFPDKATSLGVFNHQPCHFEKKLRYEKREAENAGLRELIRPCT